MAINIIGNAPNQVPTNADLGSLAFEDHDPYVDNRSVRRTAPAATTTVLDRFSVDRFRTVKYVVQATYSTFVFASEILLTHDNTSVYYTEYARLSNQPSLLLATFDAVIVGTQVNFRFTNNVGTDVELTVTRAAFTS
jgi:hypothetical protein